MTDLELVLTDLAAEGDSLDQLLVPLTPQEWSRPTPSPGWTIAHQVSHLAWTDEKARIAATDEVAFAHEQHCATADSAKFIEDGANDGVRLAPGELLARWRAGRLALGEALRASPGRLPWFGTRMSATSMATARLMETWAHGLDVADALGVTREPTPRLRHVAHLGVITRDFAYRTHGLTPPSEPFRVELVTPDGTTWTWGPTDTGAGVSGPALDFCLLVTQRRHRQDLSLVATGEAGTWLDIAQAFAGPPGSGRAPLHS